MRKIGWVKVTVAGTVLTVGLFGATANAALCRKCGDLVFIQSVGKCGECGGTTSSGSHKLCGTCSGKLAECEHCRIKIGAKGEVAGSPERRAAADDKGSAEMTDSSARKFRGALTQKARDRFTKLKANLDGFEFRIAPVLRQVDKPFYSVTLTVAGVAGEDRSDSFTRRVQIGKEQAGKILDCLLLDGFLNNATEWDTRRTYDRVSKEGYSLILRGVPNGSLDEELGWDLAMLRRLDGLRKVVDGDAAKAMDLLLGRMSGLRAEWEKKAAAAAKEDAENEAKAGPKDAEGGVLVVDSASGMTVTYSVDGQGGTAIHATDSRGRMVWKAMSPRPVTSLKIEGRTVIAMPGGMQYDLATGKLLAILGR